MKAKQIEKILEALTATVEQLAEESRDGYTYLMTGSLKSCLKELHKAWGKEEE